MSIFGSLGFGRGLAIAGGTAAVKIDRLEKDRQDKVSARLEKYIDDVVPKANDYKTKAVSYRRKMKEALNQVINTYFQDTELSKSQKIAGAKALLADHGYKMENIEKAFFDKANVAKFVYDNKPANQRTTPFSYSTTDFVNDNLRNLGQLKTDVTIDDVTRNFARVKFGDYTKTPDGFINAMKIYDGSNIFHNAYDPGFLKTTIEQSVPDLSEYSGPMTELPQVERVSKKDSFAALKEYKDFKVGLKANEVQIKKNLDAINQNALKKFDKFTPAYWDKAYKDQTTVRATEIGFDRESISFTDQGVAFVTAPQGSAQRKNFNINVATLNNLTFSDMVAQGSAINGMFEHAPFIGLINKLGKNVKYYDKETDSYSNSLRLPVTTVNGQTQTDTSKLLIGGIYDVGGQRMVYYKERNPVKEDGKLTFNNRFYVLPDTSDVGIKNSGIN